MSKAKQPKFSKAKQEYFEMWFIGDIHDHHVDDKFREMVNKILKSDLNEKTKRLSTTRKRDIRK